MNKIEIGLQGIIVEGEEKGWNLYIEDDVENTGGYLILVTPPSNSLGLNGYDNWVENLQSLEKYFQEAKWKIYWLEKGFPDV